MTASEKGWSTATKKRDEATLGEALEMTGYGMYSYVVILTCGINVLSSVCATLQLSYILPTTDCDLDLTTGQKGTLSTMMFTGMLFTTHLFGYLADEYGRRYVVLRCNLATGFLTIVSALCPGFISLSIVTLLNGAATAGVIIPSYVFAGENIKLKYRPLSILLCGLLGNLSSAILPALAIVIIPLDLHLDVFGYLTFSPWRLMLLIGSIPPFVGAIAFSMLHESPKYLLAKGFHYESLETLKHIYSVNTGRSKDEFPVQKSITLDADEIDDSANGQRRSIKRIWTQTVTLFQKPLLKFTIFSCILQAGLNGACNIVFLWLPQLVKEMMNYSVDHPAYGVTFCDVAQYKENATDPDYLVYDTDDQPCAPNVPVDMYYVSLGMGVTSFICFLISSGLTQVVSNKSLLITYTLTCGVLCGVMTLTPNMWLTIVFMVGCAILLAICLPVSISILIEFFPTSVRSTATCICMVCGRLSSTIGTQIMGLMQENYCYYSYWGLTAALFGIAVVEMIVPYKRKAPR